MKKVNPAELYRLYRRTRSAQDHEPIDLETIGSESEDFSSEVSQLYQSYRQNRDLDHSAQIDIILQKIEMENSQSQLLASIENGVHDEKQSYLSFSSSLAKLFKLPGNTLRSVVNKFRDDEGGREPSFLSKGLPALAMIVLGIVVVPFVFNSGKDGQAENVLAEASGIPASLFEVADSVASGIDSAGNSALGFSSNVSEDTRFFDLGIMVSDVSIAVAANELNQHKPIVLALTQFAKLEAEGAVKESIDDLLIELAVLPSSQPSIAKKISQLNLAVGRADADGKKSQWLELGKSVEVVSLAANYAVEGGSPRPLQDTLTRLHSLESISPINRQEELLVGLLQELSLYGGVKEPSTADARNIDRIISQIRILFK